VFAKTGSLTNVASLSGYLLRPDGSTVLFSIMSNGSGLPGSRVQGAIDQVVRILAEVP
jgi:D-alanyl-D-alanine carboxypeptidase